MGGQALARELWPEMTNGKLRIDAEELEEPARTIALTLGEVRTDDRDTTEGQVQSELDQILDAADSLSDLNRISVARRKAQA